MQTFICILLFFLSFTVNAETVITKVEDIDYPEQIHGEVLVFLSSGQVAKISNHLIALHERLHNAKTSRTWLEITLNENREITKIEETDPPIPPATMNKAMSELEERYIPSVLKSHEWANKYFKESRKNNKESQCFNRAHVWSYEWYKKHKFFSSKMFIFFTRKFIREHNFHWWFHVAPYVHVAIGNEIKERVMDIKYTKSPVTVGNWIKHFIKLDRPGCLTVQNYSDYANYPENGNCNLMRANMYYYWPLDLENEELHGTYKTTWPEEEIKTAYLEAFDIVK